MDDSSNLNKIEFIENEWVQLSVKEGIIYEYFKDYTTVNIDVAKRIVEDRLKISNQRSMPIFVDMRKVSFSDKKTMDFLDSPEASKYLTACAFQVKGVLNKMIVSLYVKFNRPPIPIRFYTNKEKAVNWLKSLNQLKIQKNQFN